MTEVPLVSIVTPSYNTAEFIEETILSVKNQTYPNIEHIIMDGGSTDGTVDIIRKYDGTYNMQWISEPDNGQSDAINKGWQQTRGEIIAYLNSDDSYEPEAVATAVEFFSNHPEIGMVYGECHIIDQYGNKTDRCQAKVFNLKEMLCRGNMVPQPATFLRRKVLDEVGFLDTGLHYCMDFDLWLRIALKFKVAYIPQYLANFRRCSGTKSVSEGYKFAFEFKNVIDKMFSTPGLPKGIRDLRRTVYSGVNYKIGVAYHSQRQMRPARRYLLKSIISNPLMIFDRWMIGYLITAFIWRSNTDSNKLHKD